MYSVFNFFLFSRAYRLISRNNAFFRIADSTIIFFLMYRTVFPPRLFYPQTHCFSHTCHSYTTYAKHGLMVGHVSYIRIDGYQILLFDSFFTSGIIRPAQMSYCLDGDTFCSWQCQKRLQRFLLYNVIRLTGDRGKQLHGSLRLPSLSVTIR